MRFSKKIICILFLGFFNGSFAQSKYNPDLLIPYNNNGKWGWSDTVGKILIKPKYNSTQFFARYEYLNKKSWVSEVNKNGTKYPYMFGYGVLPLPNCKLSNQYAHLQEKKYWTVINKKGLTGIYDLKNKKLILDTIVEDIIITKNYTNYIVYKTINATNFHLFDVNNKKSKPTNMNYRFYDCMTDEIFFKTSKDSRDVYSLNADGTFKIVEYFLRLDESDTYAVMARANSTIPLYTKEKQYFFPEAIKEKNPEIMTEFRLNGINYVVFKVNNLFGVLNNTQKEIFIPAIYQNIETISHNFILTNDDKKG